jgi:hypothetical protein
MKENRLTDLLAWSAYALLWLTALVLPNYSIFEFTGNDRAEEMHYDGYENLFDQLALLFLAAAATLLSLGRPMLWKRALLFTLLPLLTVLYLGTFIFRSASTGFSQHFHYGYFLTVFSSIIICFYAFYRQFRQPVRASDKRLGPLYGLALTFAVISLLTNMIWNPWYSLWPNLAAVLLPVIFWAADKTGRKHKRYTEVVIIWAVGVLIAVFQYVELERQIHRQAESLHRQLESLK